MKNRLSELDKIHKEDVACKHTDIQTDLIIVMHINI